MQIVGSFEVQLLGSFASNLMVAFNCNSAAEFIQLRIKHESMRHPKDTYLHINVQAVFLIQSVLLALHATGSG